MIVVIGVSLRRHKHKHFRHSVRKFLIANKPTKIYVHNTVTISKITVNMTTKTALFWDVTPCSLVDMYRRL